MSAEIRAQNLQNQYFAEYQTMDFQQFKTDMELWESVKNTILDMTIEKSSMYADYVTKKICNNADNEILLVLCQQVLDWKKHSQNNENTAAIANFALVCCTARKRKLSICEQLDHSYNLFIEKQRQFRSDNNIECITF